MEEKFKGPRLTDEEFFAELDGSIPSLAEAKKLFANGERDSAANCFKKHILSILDRDKFFSLSGKELRPDMTEKLAEKAERALSHLMVSCDTPMQFGKIIDWHANPTYNRYKEWHWQLSRHDEVMTLARAYRATCDEKYSKEAISMLLSWIEQAPRSDYQDSPYNDTLWRTIECGIRMGVWTETIYSVACSPAFDTEACLTIFKSIFEHGMRLTSQYTHGNWLMMELRGVTLISLFFPVFERCKKWKSEVVERLTEAISHQIYPDGSQYELAPGYQGVVLSNASSIEEIFGVFGERFPDVFYDKIRASLDYFAKVRMANGYMPPVNDSPAIDPVPSIRKYSATYGCSDIAKWLVDDSVKLAPPSFNSITLPYAGFVAFRTGWGEKDVSAFFDAGKFGRDHTHEDKLNLIIYDSQGPLVYEMGTYAYDNSPIRHFALKSQGHNTVLVNGCSQNRLSTKCWEESSYTHDKEPVLFYEDEELVYAYGEYDDNYGYSDYDGKEPKQLARHGRSVIMLKGKAPKDTLFIICDRLDSITGKENTYDALWHLNINNIELTDRGMSSDRISLITSGFDSMLCEKGITEGKVSGIISPCAVQGKYYPAPQLTLTARGKTCEFVSLFAFCSLEKNPVRSLTVSDGIISVEHKDGSTRTFDTERLKESAKQN